MKNQVASATPKTKTSSAKKRQLVKRGLPPMNGADNIIVVKSGEDLRDGILPLLNAMKADYESIEFHWGKLMSDPNYFDTKEYPGNTSLVAKWELQTGVRTLVDYKSRMKRLKTLIDHFRPGYDYELTLKEAVEILS